MKRALKIFGRFLKSAKTVSEQPDKVRDIFEKVDGKVDENQGPLGQIFVKTKLTGKMIRDFVTGKYRLLPKRTLIILVGAALYLLSPLDAVIDYIPFIGFMDDIFIFNFVYSQVSKDLANYIEWSRERGKKEESEANLGEITEESLLP